MGTQLAGFTVRGAAPADLDAVVHLLERCELPTEGVADWLGSFLVAEHDGSLAGTVGLELYGPRALLRSVAVLPEFRGSGLGRLLVENIVKLAADRGATDIYLLTTTADDWFLRFGFERTTREAVPTPVHASVEFRGACPGSAVVMSRPLPAPPPKGPGTRGTGESLIPDP